MHAIRALRVGLVLLLVGMLVGSSVIPADIGRWMMFLALSLPLCLFVVLTVTAAYLAQRLQTAKLLAATGQREEAQVWLGRVMTGWAMSVTIQMMAGQEFAQMLARQKRYTDVIAVCQHLLRYRGRRLSAAWVAVRTILADSLLRLDRVAEAYRALQPVYDKEMSLSERMRLLPVQLRYELATDQSALAAADLPEKLRVAELLDTKQAALVHALLAEACRRERLEHKRAFLAKRAHLYADLAPIADEHPVIAPILAS